MKAITLNCRQLSLYILLIINTFCILLPSCVKESKLIVSIDTVKIEKFNYLIPVLSTIKPNYISQKSALSGGNIINNGGMEVSARGVCWSTNPNPTTNDNISSDGTGVGIFTSSIIGLEPNTKYYARAYATNSVGTAYGNEESFTTTNIVMPTVTTIITSSLTNTSAASGGDVTNDGGTTVTARGVCWSTNPNPTTNDNISSDGTGVGIYTSSIIGLEPNTKYYVRAYATNSVGTAYGNEESFTTTNIVMPTVTTIITSSLTNTSAASGGDVTNDGGTTVTARGVCWSTSPNPTISNNFSINGTGMGSFTSSITGLLQGTIYYVRAYATNNIGIAYGNEISFILDIEGNVYTPVSIGTQVWLAENLKTTKYNDGTNVPLVADAGAWAALATPGYCWYNNDVATYKETFGALYNWFTVDFASNGGKNLAPAGWHVPTDAEWTTLINFLGGLDVAGGKMKETGTTHWTAPNTGATNESGFTALPCSYRNMFGTFSIGGYLMHGYWWSTTQSTAYNAWYYVNVYNTAAAIRLHLEKPNGFSVRCVKD